VSRAFLQDGLMRHTGPSSRRFERGEQTLSIFSALCRFMSHDAGYVDDRLGKEITWRFQMDFAGNRREMSTEGGGYRNRIVRHRDGCRLRIAHQCQKNILEGHYLTFSMRSELTFQGTAYLDPSQWIEPENLLNWLCCMNLIAFCVRRGESNAHASDHDSQADHGKSRHAYRRSREVDAGKS